MSDIPPLHENPEVLEFLASRRSRPAKTLSTPVPPKDDVERLLTIAARTPDHGKLEPWRFVVLDRNACLRLADLAKVRATEKGLDTDATQKAYNQFGNAHLVVAVVASPKDSAKIPELEQTLSAGAVCQQFLTAALASGWGANWLTAWLAFDRPFLETGLDLAQHEWVAGFMHLGTETIVPPERPRPDVSAITQWVTE